MASLRTWSCCGKVNCVHVIGLLFDLLKKYTSINKPTMNFSAQCWMQFFKNVKERKSYNHTIIQSYEHINMQAYNQTD